MKKGKTKTIKGYLVVDWRKESIRARKTKPNKSELNTNELVGDLKVTVEIPEIPVPEASATFEVPEPMVESAILEALDNRSYTDWEREAESLIAERIEAIEEANDGEIEPIIGRIVIETLRDARGRPDIDSVERYVERSVGEIRGAA